MRHTFISRLAENPIVREQVIRALAERVSRQMLDIAATCDLSQSKQRFRAAKNKQRHRISGGQRTNWAQSCERELTQQSQVRKKMVGPPGFEPGTNGL